MLNRNQVSDFPGLREASHGDHESVSGNEESSKYLPDDGFAGPMTLSTQN